MEDKEKSEIEFTYKQSSLFRVIKVDGAWGGVTPRADIQMAVFSERLAIPDSERYEVSTTSVGPLRGQSRRTDGPIREVEAMLSLSLPVARALSKWLADKADELEAAIKEQMQSNAEALKEQTSNVS